MRNIFRFRWSLLSIFIFCLGIFCFFLLVTESPTLWSARSLRAVPCKIEAERDSIVIYKSVRCYQAKFLKEINLELKNDSKISSSLTVQFKEKTGTRLSFLYAGDGHATLRIFDDTAREIGSLRDGPSNAMNRSPEFVYLDLPAKIKSVDIRIFGNAGYGVIRNLKVAYMPIAQLKTEAVQSTKLSSRWLYFISSGLLLISLLILIRLFPDMKIIHYITLTVAFFFLILYSGSPFGSGSGVYDGFDDASYLSWAHNIGYKHSLNMREALVETAAKDNIHTWGTGLFLAPAFFIMKYFDLDNSHQGYNATAFGLVNSLSILLSFFSVLIFFAAFTLIFPTYLAGVLSLWTVVATSLIKWTFFRNFFSHTPEALTLACFTYFFIRMYVTQDRSWSLVYAMMSVIIIIPQIRRENLIIGLLPLWYEFFQRQSLWSFVTRSFLLLGASIFAILLLQYSNLWTTVSGFWTNPTAYLLKSPDILANIKANLGTVFTDRYTGFFPTLNVFPFLALYGAYKTKMKYSLPFVVIVLGYLFMCLIHLSPNGAEWQNRFFLKFTPILLAGTGFAIVQMPVKIRWFALTAVIASGLYQFNLYKENLPEQFPVYVDLLTDLQILGGFNGFATKFVTFESWGSPLALIYIIIFLLVIFNLSLAMTKYTNYLNRKTKNS